MPMGYILMPAYSTMGYNNIGDTNQVLDNHQILMPANMYPEFTYSVTNPVKMEMESFWLCDLPKTSLPQNISSGYTDLSPRGGVILPHPNSILGGPLNYANQKAEDQILPLEMDSSEPKQKKKLLLQQRIENKRPKILRSLELVNNESVTLINARTKAAPRNTTNSSRRSNFIGVFKNGPNWQALISINKKKTYIGTYATEEVAAKAFDYHSILLHNLTATTNYSYNKRQILQLFEKFAGKQQ